MAELNANRDFLTKKEMDEHLECSILLRFDLNAKTFNLMAKTPQKNSKA